MGVVSAAPAARPEVVAGRYRLGRLLGRGGLGSVYQVHDMAADKRLALKRLSKDASPVAAALFEREYHALAGLRHPGIVEVFEYGRDDGVPFYTMELIEGGDLGTASLMPWREVCRNVRDTASILGVLHARQLVHRDLSPRNLLRSQSGRLKLIDFGAVAPFGPTKQLVGTPPFVAPEALGAARLDQRTDLFALGAIAYWLMTGVHAFPARTLSDLPRHWEYEVVPASELLRLRNSGATDPIPPELDALVAWLLRIDPAQRLSSTAELIDRLNAIAGLEPEAEESIVQSYLNSKAFVGREPERDRALALLLEASHGCTRTLLVDAEPGVGRTRFLQELVVLSRLQGAVPLVAYHDQGAKPYGAAETLLLTLLRAAPELSRALASEHAALLGYISKEVSAELQVSPRPSLSHATAEIRLRILTALSQVFLAVSRSVLLAIFVDDLADIDEESQALLTTLAHAENGHRLMIVATVRRVTQRESSPALTHLHAKSAHMSLSPLTARETLELLRSVFGAAPYLERLAERLYRASEGNPAFCLELAQHLVQTGAASYQDGAFSLPVELMMDRLPQSRQAAYIGRLDRLSPEARQLARWLSVPHSTALTDAQCFAVSLLPRVRVKQLLDELEREAVLCVRGEGRRFAHASVQTALHEELSSADRVEAHRQLGEQLASLPDPDVLDDLRACAHFLRAGELKRAFAKQLAVLHYFARGELALLSRAAPLLAEVYALHRERGHDKYAVVGVLGLLGIAGFYADRSYARRFGDLAIETMQDVLELSLARRLAPLIGEKRALLLALAWAGIALRRRSDRAPAVEELVRQMMGAAASLTGTAACCIDAKGVARYAEVIEPFTVLGEDDAANVMYRCALANIPHLTDEPARASELLLTLIARLESSRPIRGLPDGIKVHYLAGALSLLGVVQSWRDSPECLQTADRIERFSPLYAMNADFLRSSYHSFQGDLERAAHFRQRMEVHAVQLGSAWQAETWAPADAIKTGLRTQDASLIKRAVEELSVLREEVPALASIERSARGAYLVLRRNYTQAIALLEDDTGRGTSAGWTRDRSLLALAYNEIGRHALARDVCVHALKFRRPEDLTYVAMNLGIQIELALAEAGLGNLALAERQLEELLLLHGPHESAITLGSLHHARGRVALRARDFDAAREHLDQMDRWYRSTTVATLIEVVEAFRRELGRAQSPHGTRAGSEVLTERTRLVMVRIEELLGEPLSPELPLRAARGLLLAADLVGATEGFIVLAENASVPVAQLGGAAPANDVVGWAEQRMLAAGIDEQTLVTQGLDSEVGSSHRGFGAAQYCVAPLWTDAGRGEQVVGALVLGFEGRAARLPEPAVLHAIARHVMGRERA